MTALNLVNLKTGLMSIAKAEEQSNGDRIF